MTDRLEPQRDNPARPLGGLDDLDDQARAGIGGHGDDEDRLPEHETRDENTVGGGLMSEGGTAVDRGTGTLSGEAQDKGDPEGERTGALGLDVPTDD